MTCAKKLFERDAAARKTLGWGENAFLFGGLPEPTTEIERVAQDMMTPNAVTYHAYDVVEMLEIAIQFGMQRGRDESEAEA